MRPGRHTTPTGIEGGPGPEDLARWPRVPVEEALATAPERPGVYAWWARDARAARLLGLTEEGAQLPLYVGMARSDLRWRVWGHCAVHDNFAETELRTRLHFWVAVVLGLVPWHIQQLVDFDEEREWGDSLLYEWAYQAISAFMERFLSVSWTTAPDGSRARAWEARLIREISPMFNVAGARVHERDWDWLEARVADQVIEQSLGIGDFSAIVTLLHEQPAALAAARRGPIGMFGLEEDDGEVSWIPNASADGDRWDVLVDLRDRRAIDGMACLLELLEAPQARELYGPGPSAEEIAADMTRFEREVCHLWGTCRVMGLEQDERPTSPYDLPSIGSALAGSPERSQPGESPQKRDPCDGG